MKMSLKRARRIVTGIGIAAMAGCLLIGLLPDPARPWTAVLTVALIIATLIIKYSCLRCPCCRKQIALYGEKYCPHCGKKILWE